MSKIDGPHDDVVLILMEAGSLWPAWVESDEAERVVIHQGDESIDRFGARVAERTVRLARHRNRVRCAVVACSDRTDPKAQGARRAIVQALLASGDRPEILFTTGERASGASRRVLSGLVSDVNATVGVDVARCGLRWADRRVA